MEALLTEVGRRWSPYNYCYNNPIRFIDPDGMMAAIGGGVDKGGITSPSEQIETEQKLLILSMLQEERRALKAIVPVVY